MHASRTGPLSGDDRGGRVRNTWLTCPPVGDRGWKRPVIPSTLATGDGGEESRKALVEGAAAD